MNQYYKKVAFTICSNNYLAQAKTLGDSLLQKNPDYHFIIGLVDRKNSLINYDEFQNFEIIEVEALGISYFEELWKKYDIVELNTTVKPSYFKYIFTEKKADIIIYFDPDIIVFNKLDVIESDLVDHDVVLSPHFCSPQIDDLNPSDYDMLRTGAYNLGFLGLKTTNVSMHLCNWWEKQLRYFGQADLSKGLFTDQIWMHFAPCFTNAKISKHLGYNVANWNLHERVVTKKENEYFINSTYPLIFFHFSNYKPSSPNTLAGYNTRFLLSDKPDCVEIFSSYINLLYQNKHTEFSKVIPVYTLLRSSYLQTIADEERKSLLLLPTLKRLFKRILKLF